MKSIENDNLIKIFSSNTILLNNIQSLHYNIKNWNFLTLHITLENHYKAIEPLIDEIAELCVMKFNNIDSRLSAITKNSIIQEVDFKYIDGNQQDHTLYNDMLKDIEAYYDNMVKMLQEAHEQTKCIVSQDIFAKHAAIYMKMKWMIEASTY
jgi:DNA-binding ferritin-like protein